MLFKRAFILAVLVFTVVYSHAQVVPAQVKRGNFNPEEMPEPGLRSIHIGDSIFIMPINCKGTSFIQYSYQAPEPGRKTVAAIAPVPPKRIPFLRVHGNILYNFAYRSFIDTPFAQQDLQQHLVQTYMDFVVKDKYPVRMIVTHRNSNSPYFRNTTDVNLQFNRQQLLNNIKNDLRNKATQYVNTDYLKQAEQLYSTREQKVQQLQGWLNSPARMQEQVEEKERALRGNVPQLPAVNNLAGRAGMSLPSVKDKNKIAGKLLGKLKQEVKDTVTGFLKDTLAALTARADSLKKDSSVSEKYTARKKQYDSLKKELGATLAKTRLEKKKAQDSLNKVKAEINGLNTSTGLFAFMKKHGIAKNELTKAQRVLLNINQVGIGRSWLDYSELTVKNTSLSGVHIEMNPLPFYVAAAVGKVNYRFRDFILKNSNTVPDQPLYVLRAGIGQKEKNNFILTWYNGKKAILNYTAANTPAAVQRVMGVSAEMRLALDPNNYIVAEVAKSSYHANGTNPGTGDNPAGKVFNFKTSTNMAYSIKLYSQYPQTNTRLTGYYKKTGENFQSFNLNPINVNQDAWMVRVNQSFWKKRVLLDGAIRKNDFASPVAAPGFNTKTVFKSIQASVRIPKYPFVSVGYYPASQLSLLNNNVLVENQYNTLNMVMSHSYQLRKTGMNTNAVYTRFYNQGSDTGFIYYNASSWTVNHSFFLQPFVLQSSIGKIEQKDLELVTLEQLVSYQYKNILTLTGSLKWNRLNGAESLWGGTAGMGIQIKKLGTLQLNYDKTYLPGMNRVLLPVDMGRMSFYREF